MIQWLADNAARVAQLAGLHATLALAATVIGLLLAVVVGSLVARRPRISGVLLTASGVLFTIPSLTLFIFIPLIIGTQILDPQNIVIALTVYTFALLFGGVIEALHSVPEETMQASAAMGMGPVRRLFQIELPMAIPVIAANLRVAAVSNVSLVSVGALIGVGGLGDLFTEGFQRSYLVPIVWGIIFTVVLALLVDLVVVVLERLATPWVRAGEAR
ncbi:ABC transporter permease [Leucobacter luti]|uniref:Osmoprotectant transport system permease protein n=1 Tax=Leucobacter luti TaxID=340320 RepID=A0A4R6S0W9_9MICO|nr:ABC transporter permease subunit [Leucobacter luti]MCW2287654.1 osmoprotectant transport system permease protein [Leucobacter luti]TCK46181.1 osmoprotectant transport system permease protein [Leucobacter luti]TDP92607.1 osmoprotectant transport system permease protein [Leucobacter luti]